MLHPVDYRLSKNKFWLSTWNSYSLKNYKNLILNDKILNVLGLIFSNCFKVIFPVAAPWTNFRKFRKYSRYIIGFDGRRAIRLGPNKIKKLPNFIIPEDYNIIRFCDFSILRVFFLVDQNIKAWFKKQKKWRSPLFYFNMRYNSKKKRKTIPFFRRNLFNMVVEKKNFKSTNYFLYLVNFLRHKHIRLLRYFDPTDLKYSAHYFKKDKKSLLFHFFYNNFKLLNKIRNNYFLFYQKNLSINKNTTTFFLNTLKVNLFKTLTLRFIGTNFFRVNKFLFFQKSISNLRSDNNASITFKKSLLKPVRSRLIFKKISSINFKKINLNKVNKKIVNSQIQILKNFSYRLLGKYNYFRSKMRSKKQFFYTNLNIAMGKKIISSSASPTKKFEKKNFLLKNIKLLFVFKSYKVFNKKSLYFSNNYFWVHKKLSLFKQQFYAKYNFKRSKYKKIRNYNNNFFPLIFFKPWFRKKNNLLLLNNFSHWSYNNDISGLILQKTIFKKYQKQSFLRKNLVLDSIFAEKILWDKPIHQKKKKWKKFKGNKNFLKQKSYKTKLENGKSIFKNKFKSNILKYLKIRPIPNSSKGRNPEFREIHNNSIMERRQKNKKFSKKSNKFSVLGKKNKKSNKVISKGNKKFSKKSNKFVMFKLLVKRNKKFPKKSNKCIIIKKNKKPSRVMFRLLLGTKRNKKFIKKSKNFYNTSSIKSTTLSHSRFKKRNNLLTISNSRIKKRTRRNIVKKNLIGSFLTIKSANLYYELQKRKRPVTKRKLRIKRRILKKNVRGRSYIGRHGRIYFRKNFNLWLEKHKAHIRSKYFRFAFRKKMYIRYWDFQKFSLKKQIMYKKKYNILFNKKPPKTVNPKFFNKLSWKKKQELYKKYYIKFPRRRFNYKIWWKNSKIKKAIIRSFNFRYLNWSKNKYRKQVKNLEKMYSNIYYFSGKKNAHWRRLKDLQKVSNFLHIYFKDMFSLSFLPTLSLNSSVYHNSYKKKKLISIFNKYLLNTRNNYTYKNTLNSFIGSSYKKSLLSKTKNKKYNFKVRRLVGGSNMYYSKTTLWKKNSMLLINLVKKKLYSSFFLIFKFFFNNVFKKKNINWYKKKVNKFLLHNKKINKKKINFYKKVFFNRAFYYKKIFNKKLFIQKNLERTKFLDFNFLKLKDSVKKINNYFSLASKKKKLKAIVNKNKKFNVSNLIFLTKLNNKLKLLNFLKLKKKIYIFFKKKLALKKNLLILGYKKKKKNF